MLNWVWFGVLTVVGIALALKCVVSERDRKFGDDDSAGRDLQLASHAVLATALFASEKVPVLYAWLKASLPESGSAINEITALAVTAFACLAYAFGMPLAIMVGDYVRRDRAQASRAAKKVIDRVRAR